MLVRPIFGHPCAITQSMQSLTSAAALPEARLAASEPQLVTIPDTFPAGEDGVEVVMHRKMAAAEPVGVTGGQPGDEPRHEGRIRAAAGQADPRRWRAAGTSVS
jgi:hypothetical protein